jgi:hypothetical protein
LRGLPGQGNRLFGLGHGLGFRPLCLGFRDLGLGILDHLVGLLDASSAGVRRVRGRRGFGDIAGIELLLNNTFGENKGQGWKAEQGQVVGDDVEVALALEGQCQKGPSQDQGPEQGPELRSRGSLIFADQE